MVVAVGQVVPAPATFIVQAPDEPAPAGYVLQLADAPHAGADVAHPAVIVK